jgi:hypothetical protein
MWKITDIQATDGLITSAKYHVVLEKDGYSADTEGYWNFIEPSLKTPFDQVTEEMVAGWIQTESAGAIEQRLQDQITALAATKRVVAPWLPQTFSIGDQ